MLLFCDLVTLFVRKIKDLLIYLLYLLSASSALCQSKAHHVETVEAGRQFSALD